MTAERTTLLGPKELMAEFGLSARQFYRLQARGAFDRFRVHPPIGRKCYSAYLVDRWKRGEAIDRSSVFGRKRTA